jgi:hypothetical protein
MKIPIACTLTVDEMPDRLRDWQELRERALLSATEIPGGMRLRFAADAQADVQQLVAAEQVCCAFLEFVVHDGNVDDDRGAFVVDVLAPAGAEVVTRALAGR